MRYFKNGLAVLALAMATACSTALEPKVAATPVEQFSLVDMQRVDAVQYQKDYESCAHIANQDDVDLSRTAMSAVSVAAEKASMGVIGGKPGKHADRISVLKRCLTGRGYTVLR